MLNTEFIGEIRHTSFNTIYIVESLPQGESCTGKELHQQLKHRSLQIDGLRTRYEAVSTRKAFVKLLHRIEDGVANGLMPFLHLEIHGNTKGLRFANGEDMEWDSLHQHLRRLNISTRNNLLVSFAACRAAATYFDIDVMKPAPFIGVIAPFVNVSVEEVEEGFLAFFDELLTSFHLPAAVDALNNASASSNFQFLYAEGFFDMLWRNIEGMYTNPITYRQRILDTMSNALSNRNIRHNYSLPELRYEIENYFNPDGRAALRAHYFRVFMMLK